MIDVSVRRFLTFRWLLRHLAMVVLVAAFLTLGWWQIGRARQGNVLSYGYAFEWPLFALFVVFIWTREVRGELRTGPPPAPPPSSVPEDLRIEVPLRPSPPAEDDDPETRAYNEYLARLNEQATPPGSGAA